MNLGNNFQDQVVCKCSHLRPVFDVRAKLDLYAWICYALAVKYTVLVDGFVEIVFMLRIASVKLLSRSKESFVCCCSCNGTCIHKCNRRNLAVLDLGAFTVREVSGCMTDTERIVCRCISGTEARSAECSLHNCACSDKFCKNAVLSQFHVDWSTCRIYA